MKPYRRWLGAESYEARASIGGSFASRKIEDYYFTPWDMGYGSFIDFDHDFIGREALQKMAKGPHRKKVTLALDDADVVRAIASQLGKGERAKFMEFPSAVYSMHPFDNVVAGGRSVGVSTWVGYSSNEGKLLTLAVLEAGYADPGTKVTFVWGEENGGTSKPTVERHKQVEIKAVVSPVPYVEAVRKTYTEGGWRKQA
jgi:syringate O-demethylase